MRPVLIELMVSIDRIDLGNDCLMSDNNQLPELF